MFILSKLKNILAAGLVIVWCGGAWPAYATRAAEAQPPVGQHHIQFGDTLYSLGRAYGVEPAAIAAANGLGPLAWLAVGQTLIIPAAPWASIPAGPVSQPQFQSPFPALPPNLDQAFTPAGGTSGQMTPFLGTTPAATGRHQVRGGETLFSIGRAYGVLPSAIAAANGLTAADLIFPGQALIIPAVPWRQIEPGPVTQPQSPSPVGFVLPSGTTWLAANVGNVFVPTFNPGAPGVLLPGVTLPNPVVTPAGDSGGGNGGNSPVTNNDAPPAADTPAPTAPPSGDVTATPPPPVVTPPANGYPPGNLPPGGYP